MMNLMILYALMELINMSFTAIIYHVEIPLSSVFDNNYYDVPKRANLEKNAKYCLDWWEYLVFREDFAYNPRYFVNPSVFEKMESYDDFAVCILVALDQPSPIEGSSDHRFPVLDMSNLKREYKKQKRDLLIALLLYSLRFVEKTELTSMFAERFTKEEFAHAMKAASVSPDALTITPLVLEYFYPKVETLRYLQTSPVLNRDNNMIIHLSLMQDYENFKKEDIFLTLCRLYASSAPEYRHFELLMKMAMDHKPNGLDFIKKTVPEFLLEIGAEPSVIRDWERCLNEKLSPVLSTPEIAELKEIMNRNDYSHILYSPVPRRPGYSGDEDISPPPTYEEVIRDSRRPSPQISTHNPYDMNLLENFETIEL